MNKTVTLMIDGKVVDKIELVNVEGMSKIKTLGDDIEVPFRQIDNISLNGEITFSGVGISGMAIIERFFTEFVIHWGWMLYVKKHGYDKLVKRGALNA